MSSTAGRRQGHAVIAGASIGGLVAARALSESFERVTLIDRDRLPAAPAARRGVPQSRMLHGLIAMGKVALDELFPRFSEEMSANGAAVGDGQSDLQWYLDGRLLKPVPSGLTVLNASRPLLEFTLRARVAALPGVTIMDGHDVTGLITTPGRSAVTGVRLQRRDAAAAPPMTADLVVDATGRGSRGAWWLDELGYARAAEETVRVGIVYTRRIYRREPRLLGGRIGTVAAAYPGGPNGGIVLAQEGESLILALTGTNNVTPPADPDGMAAYADALPTPDFAEIIRTATPLSEPATMRFPASIRRRYENLSELPEGFLVVADALCAFNPVYGQGMTVAALEAQALLRLLREGREDITRRFFRAAAEIVDSPWNIMLGNDLRFPHAEGPLTPQIGQSAQYMDAFRAAAADDAVLATALLRVLHLIDPPARLQDPALRQRVARATKAAA